VALPQGFLDGGWFSAWPVDGGRRSWLVRSLSLTDKWPATDRLKLISNYDAIHRKGRKCGSFNGVLDLEEEGGPVKIPPFFLSDLFYRPCGEAATKILNRKHVNRIKCPRNS